MKPRRYRCAPIAALAFGLLFLPTAAPAQGKFSTGLRSAMAEVSELIDMGQDQHRPRAQIRKLEAALAELARVHGHGMGNMPTSQPSHFTSGLKSATRDVSDLLGPAVERDRTHGDVRHLERALRDLHLAFEGRSGYGHSRVADGARYLCRAPEHEARQEKANSPAGKAMTANKQLSGEQIKQKDAGKVFDPARAHPAAGNLAGNRVAQNIPVAAPGVAKQGPGQGGTRKAPAGPGNLVAQRKQAGAAPATVKNNGANPMQQHGVKLGAGQQHNQACAKQGLGNFVNAKAVTPRAGPNMGIPGGKQQAGMNMGLGHGKQQAGKNKNAGPGNLVGARQPNNQAGRNIGMGNGKQQPGMNTGLNNGKQHAGKNTGLNNGKQHAGKNKNADPGNLVGTRQANKNVNTGGNAPGPMMLQPAGIRKNAGNQPQQAFAKQGPGNKNAGANNSAFTVNKHGAGNGNRQAPGNLVGNRAAGNGCAKPMLQQQTGFNKLAGGNPFQAFFPQNGAGRSPHAAAPMQRFTPAMQGHGNVNMGRHK